MEVGSGQGRLQVADHGTATLAITVVVNGMAKDFGFTCRICIDCDFGIASTSDKPLFRGRVSRLLIQDFVIGSDVIGSLRLNQAVDRGQDISIFPARREVGVKVRLRRLKEQSSIDRARTTDGATHESVDLIGATGQTGSAGKDGTEESWYVDAAQICAYQPTRSLGASRDAVGWPASLQKKDFFGAALTQPTRYDDPRGTRTDHDDIP